MANHDVLIMDRSSVLTYVDLTDGFSGTIEINHVDYVNVRKNAVDKSLFLQLDGSGGRSVKYLHDGQLGDENTDYLPAVVGTSSWNFPQPSNRFSGAEIAPNVFIETPYSGNQPSFINTVLKNETGAVIDTFLTASTSFVINTDNPVVNYSGNISFSSLYLNDTRQAIITSENSGMYFQGFYWFLMTELETIATTEYRNVYLLKCTKTSDTTMLLVGTRILIQTYATAEDPTVLSTRLTDGSFYLNATADGKIWIQAGNTTDYYSWNGVTLDYFSTIYYMFLKQAMASRTIGDSCYLGFSNNNWTNLRDTGWSFAKLELATMVKSDVIFPACPQIPADGTFFRVRKLVPSNYKYIECCDYYNTATGAVAYRKLLVCDALTGTVQFIDLSKINYGHPCSLGDMNAGKAVLISIPAYKVDGTITKDGVGVETGLILIDNTSQKIIGRTRSDPVTGYYKFRCWTTGTKSVLAQHPVSKGLRIAAESVPVLEA